LADMAGASPLPAVVRERGLNADTDVV
jgi:hypothetical protein